MWTLKNVFTIISLFYDLWWILQDVKKKKKENLQQYWAESHRLGSMSTGNQPRAPEARARPPVLHKNPHGYAEPNSRPKHCLRESLTITPGPPAFSVFTISQPRLQFRRAQVEHSYTTTEPSPSYIPSDHGGGGQTDSGDPRRGHRTR